VSCRMFCPFLLVVISPGWPLKRHTESFRGFIFSFLCSVGCYHSSYFGLLLLRLGCCCRYEDSIRWAMIYYHLIWEWWE
jgi:hypothetical protein